MIERHRFSFSDIIQVLVSLCCGLILLAMPVIFDTRAGEIVVGVGLVLCGSQIGIVWQRVFNCPT
jgi:hypothetical protein